MPGIAEMLAKNVTCLVVPYKIADGRFKGYPSTQRDINHQVKKKKLALYV